ncbi:MAG: bacteriohemerythrin [Phaeospirillum sp.]|nr:bacteriohemerythrin [Phaeospirillum sp.]
MNTKQAVEIFPWNDNFATGIDIIDIQHRRLIELLNVLVAHLAFQRNAPAIEQVISELKDYAATHFAAEEAIWSAHFKGDSWEEWHKDAHSDFVGKIVEMSGETEGKSYEEVIEHIVSFLTHWLALHIIESDKRMAKVVLALPSGISLERAKELANKEMSGATRILIETVMGMYDNLAHKTIQLTREINARIKSEAALKETQAELVRLKDEAVEGERRTIHEIKNFAYVLSHHFQEPVREQLLYTSKLRKIIGKQGAPESELADTVAQIVHGGERLRILLADMQSHMALSYSPWKPKYCATSDALDQALHRLARKIRECGAVIEHGELPSARVDRERLSDIFAALVDNSMMFHQQSAPPLIRITCEVKADQLEFHVEDNGIGIAEDMRERVFGVFERLHPQEAFSGTGIGLAVVRKIIESAGGRVWIEAASSGGTRVCFTVPSPPSGKKH